MPSLAKFRVVQRLTGSRPAAGGNASADIDERESRDRAPARSAVQSFSEPSPTSPSHGSTGEPTSTGGPARGLARFLAARPSARVVVAFLIVFVAASLISSRFPTTSNLLSVLQAMTFEGLLAVGVGLVLIGGEIDISVGSTFSLAGVVAAVALSHGATVGVAIAIALGVGLGCGLVNGLVAELFQIPAVVVTLATLGVYAGLALVISGGSPVSSIGDHPGFFTGFGTGTVVGQLSWLSVIYVAVAFIAGLVLQGTTFGFRVFAVGSNPRAARLVGINVGLIRVGLLTVSGLTAGAAAVLSLAYLQSASPISGTSYALDVLAAVIIGGVSLTGGRGTMLGVFLGLGVVQIISNMLTLTGVSPNWQSAVSGLVLVLAVGVQRLGVRRDARR